MKALLFVILLFTMITYAQNNSKQMISLIEQGKSDSAKTLLEKEIKKRPKDLELIFVSALINPDADESMKQYHKVAADRNCAYSESAINKLYQYYYALGSYAKAQNWKDSLAAFFPKSKYLSVIESSEEKEVSEDVKLSEAKPIVKDEVAVKEGTVVQIGAFSKKEKAKELVKKITEKKITLSVKEKNVAGAILFVVTASGFKNESAAKKFSEKVNKEFSLQSRILTK